MKENATFYIVATPIGNLADMSTRAIETLNTVNYILAEDTRLSGKLLKHFNITTKMFSLHEYNEKEKYANILNLLKNGNDIALISDAGTPLISDPGFYLIKNLHKEQIKIIPIPGACAAITALCASGIASDKFMFLGFLSAKKGARIKELEECKNINCTMIFYESPHRILETIADMVDIFGINRLATIARELTKIYENIFHASLKDILDWLKLDANNCRGEFVIVVSKCEENFTDKNSVLQTLDILLKELPLKQAVKLTAEITGSNKNELYQTALMKK